MNFHFMLAFQPFAFLIRMIARLVLHFVGAVAVVLMYDSKFALNPVASALSWMCLMGVASGIFTFLFMRGFDEDLKEGGSFFWTVDRFFYWVGTFFILSIAMIGWYDMSIVKDFINSF